MKKYFLHNGTESNGPFDLEELKSKSITKSSYVWYDGMPDWKIAGNIPELQPIFMVVPPPLKMAPPTTKKIKKKEITTILGLNKTTFFVVFGILVLIVFTVVFNVMEDNRSIELEQKNHKTEIENQKFLLQQKEIEEEKNRVAAQERIEAERIAEERKQTISNRLLEIKDILVKDQSNLEESKNNLIKNKDFKLLRTAAERNQEISTNQTEIDSLKNEIINLGKETNRLNLELRKT